MGAAASASNLGTVFVYKARRSFAQNNSLNEWLPAIDYFNHKVLQNHHIRSAYLQQKTSDPKESRTKAGVETYTFKPSTWEEEADGL